MRANGILCASCINKDTINIVLLYRYQEKKKKHGKGPIDIMQLAVNVLENHSTHFDRMTYL